MQARTVGQSEIATVHSTQRTAVLERRLVLVWLVGQPDPALVLQHIRDEAHRFAITYHKKLRGKATVTSRLAEIPGMVPSLKEEMAGCLFAPRCGHATERCRRDYPPLEEKTPGHWVACWEADRLQGVGA